MLQRITNIHLLAHTIQWTRRCTSYVCITIPELYTSAHSAQNSIAITSSPSCLCSGMDLLTACRPHTNLTFRRVTGLFRSAWRVRITWIDRMDSVFGTIGKILAVLLPALIIGIARTTAVLSRPTLYFIISDILRKCPTASSALLD